MAKTSNVRLCVHVLATRIRRTHRKGGEGGGAASVIVIASVVELRLRNCIRSRVLDLRQALLRMVASYSTEDRWSQKLLI